MYVHILIFVHKGFIKNVKTFHYYLKFGSGLEYICY